MLNQSTLYPHRRHFSGSMNRSVYDVLVNPGVVSCRVKMIGQNSFAAVVGQVYVAVCSVAAITKWLVEFEASGVWIPLKLW